MLRLYIIQTNYMVIIILSLLYALSCIWLTINWLSIKYNSQKQPIPADLFLSVIIPVRNEAANISTLLTDLSLQHLPKNQFEVIIVDDSSTDDTAQIVRDFKNKNGLNLTLIQLPNERTDSPKKRAIGQALKISKGQLIVTTDGDCRVETDWLLSIAQTYATTNAKFISGPVVFDETRSENVKSGFSVFQTIEFSSLIGTGGCLIAAGVPTMCNGANLAYDRAAFDKVGGYTGTDHIASGDDELLMHKFAEYFPNDIVFLKNKAAIVSTQPQPNWTAFRQQRIRWASKWAVNKRWGTMLVALFVFIANFLTILTLILFAYNFLPTNQFILILTFKLVPEFIFLSLVLHFLKKSSLIVFIPFVQLIYPLYVVFFGLISQQKNYEWKGRQLS
jgi:cellulose synthase/poly-beta-1,6-N-acetylglucosamine synthase-like glycosyltransferase